MHDRRFVGFLTRSVDDAAYALLVNDKVYTLKAANDAQKSMLDKLAGEKAAVTGDLKGETLAVASIKAAK